MIANEGEWCLVAASGAEWSVMTGNDGFSVMFVTVHVEVWKEVV